MNCNSDFSFSLFKALKQILVGGLLLWNVSACATTETIHWKEEVVLHDGKTIVVNRSVTLGGNIPREIGQGPGESNYTLSFTVPDGKEIDWENPGNLRLMILDFDGITPYLATEPAMVIHYFEYGCPDPAYVFLKYENGWQRINYEDFPTKLRNTNLMIPSKKWLAELKDRLVTTGEAMKRNSDLSKHYKIIDPNHHSPDICPPQGKNKITGSEPNSKEKTN